MKLSLIPPLQYLNLDDLLPIKFCIASLANMEGYLGHYQARIEQGHTVIMDNGIFEDDAVHSTLLIERANIVKPSILIIPDTIGAAVAENQNRAEEFIELCKQELVSPKTELMFVPQTERGNTTSGWQSLEWAISHPDIKWIGICRDLCYNMFGHNSKTTSQELNRFYFTVQFQASPDLFGPFLDSKTKMHYLGVGDEWFMLQHYWFVESMDTASLFWQSWNTNLIQNGVLKSESSRPADYFIRDWDIKNTDHWFPILLNNVEIAQSYATMALHNRRRIVGDRI